MKTALKLLLISSALFFWPLTFEQFETPKSWILISFACFSAFYVNWKNAIKDERSIVFFAFVVSSALSTIFSIDRNMSIWGNPQCPNGLLVTLSYFIVYLAIDFETHVWNGYKFKLNYSDLVDVIVFSGTTVSIYSIAQAMGFDFMAWNGTIKEGTFVRPPSSLGHPNFMAAYLAMVLPFSLQRIKGYGFKVGLYVTCSALMVVSIILSQSRGMWLASISSLSMYLFLTNAQLRSIVCGILGIVGLSAIVFFAFPQFRYGAEYRSKLIFTPSEPRLFYPTAAISIWKKYPLLGSGLDTFETAFQHERTDRYWEIERAGSPTRAHCEILNILATQGILGAGLVLLFSWLIFWRLFKYPNTDPAIASAITAFYVGNISGFTVISTGVLFVVCIGLLKESK